MNKKLNRVLDEIQKTEGKIAVWQEHLRELNILREQLEDQEIVKSVRSMKLDSRQMLAFLEQIQNGAMENRQSGKEDMAEYGESHKVPEGAEEPEKEVRMEQAPEREDCNEEN